MIKIEVRLYATLLAYCPALKAGEPLVLELGTGTTVAQLLENLAIPANNVQLVFVNGRMQGQSYILAEGDRVAFFPPVGGG
jgi:molybdopterin synthase sulfur carrier subunit